MAHFRLSDAPIDAVALQSGLRDPRAGACASFEGWVRDHNDGRAVDGLRYEAYVSLAEAEGAFQRRGVRVVEGARLESV
jgi:molybdopterin synthase catalytic subunit